MTASSERPAIADRHAIIAAGFLRIRQEALVVLVENVVDAGIEAEAREKIQSAIREAQAARDQIITEATGRSRDLVSRAEQEADRERQEAMVALRKQIVDLAMGATEKVIGEGLDEKRQRQLINDFITTGGGSAGPASPAGA